MSKQTIGGQVILPPHKNPQLAECHGDLLPDLDRSVWDMLFSTATQHQNGDAVVSLWQPKTHLDNLVLRNNYQDQLRAESEIGGSREEEGHFRWTYEELVKATELVAGLLQSKGCVEGENLVWTPSPTFLPRMESS